MNSPCLGYCQNGTLPCPIPEHCRSAHLPQPEASASDNDIDVAIALKWVAACVLVCLALIGAGALTAYLSTP